MYTKISALTFDQVSEWVAYDGETGVFTLRKARSRRYKQGTELGEIKSRIDKGGIPRKYKYIGVLFQQIPAARVAWLLTYGKWPQGNILFKDGDTLNVKIDNLKEGDYPAIITVKGTKRMYKTPPKGQRHYALQQNYGISLETYKVMLAAQGGVCAICKGTETYIPKNKMEPKALSVDHNHETGAIRGLLCSNCNYMIGHCQENREILLEGVKYLDKHAGRDARPTLTIVPTEDQK